MLALCLALVPFCYAASDIPDPSDDFYILDEAGVLSQNTTEEIMWKNESLE